MSEVVVRDLSFRPAFPDEESRANFIEAGRPQAGGLSGWFLAVTDDKPERIVATIRYGAAPRLSGEALTVDFRMTGGPGGELADREEDFLSAFISSLGEDFRGKIRHLPLLQEGHPWERAFTCAGFSIRYREYHLEAPVRTLAARVSKSHAALKRFPSPLENGSTVPVRECGPDEAIRLLTKLDLMNEGEIRALWETEDRRVLDRDSSCCFMLDGEMLGVVLAADAGENLKIMAIAVREDLPGAKLWVTPHLMHHLFQATAHRNYRQAFFRSNAETAPTTFNFATRAGGKVVADLRRWVREIG